MGLTWPAIGLVRAPSTGMPLVSCLSFGFEDLRCLVSLLNRAAGLPAPYGCIWLWVFSSLVRLLMRCLMAEYWGKGEQFMPCLHLQTGANGGRTNTFVGLKSTKQHTSRACWSRGLGAVHIKMPNLGLVERQSSRYRLSRGDRVYAALVDLHASSLCMSHSDQLRLRVC
jgi:hypothetical protein